MKKPKNGDTITVKHRVEGYYSNYGGKPAFWLEPGMPAVVWRIDTPKVRIISKEKRDETQDGNPHFIIVDFVSPVTGKLERTGVNFCNWQPLA